MKRSSGARLGATAVVSVLSLALITGCSGDGPKDTADAKASGSAASKTTAPAAKALGAADLEKLLLAQGEVKGYKVDSGDDTLPKSKSEVETDKAECAPLAWATAGLAPGDTAANASNSVQQAKASDKSVSAEDAGAEDIANAFDVTMTFVGLSSYDGDGAEKALKAVSDGVKACSGGYGLKADGEDTKVTKVTAAKSAGGGDESVAFAEQVDMDGEGTATFNTEVIRKGNTVATFYTVNFAAFATGDAMENPAAVVQAQVAKLK
ncbi:hypothetical protein [Streptomyces adustus]|uniref:hypothetical protein n=1 Tax=Streptomyces adustus TaxID=1609272 RepID=UPI0037225E08